MQLPPKTETDALEVNDTTTQALNQDLMRAVQHTTQTHSEMWTTTTIPMR